MAIIIYRHCSRCGCRRLHKPLKLDGEIVGIYCFVCGALVEQVTCRGKQQAGEDLLRALTPEGAAFRANGLRNLECALLAREYASLQEREQVLAEFYSLARRLRKLDAEFDDGGR